MIADLRVWEWTPAFGMTSLILGAVIAITLLMDLRMEKYDEEYPFERRPAALRVAVAMTMLVIVTIFSATQSNAFIYFQF